MSTNSTIFRGSFVSAGLAVNIPVPTGFDCFQVWNYTAVATAEAGADDMVYGIWRVGMPVGGGLAEIMQGSQANEPNSWEQLVAPAGFTPYNSTVSVPGAKIVIANSAGSNAANPVYLTANTQNMAVGAVVRLFNLTGQPDLSGYDFAISAVTNNVSFTLGGTLANVPGAAATAGQYAIIPFDPYFYPTVRYITSIVSAGLNTVVTTSIPTGYVVGQAVRVIVPADEFAGVSVYGMQQINNLVGTVVAVDNALGVGHQSVTLNIDSSGFTAFSFPTAAQAVIALRKAMLVPVGVDTAVALAQMQNILSDARVNLGTFGMTLAAGASSPAGQNGDLVFWEASTSYLY